VKKDEDSNHVIPISLLHQEWIEDVNYEAIRISRGFFSKFLMDSGLPIFISPSPIMMIMDMIVVQVHSYLKVWLYLILDSK